MPLLRGPQILCTCEFPKTGPHGLCTSSAGCQPGSPTLWPPCTVVVAALLPRRVALLRSPLHWQPSVSPSAVQKTEPQQASQVPPTGRLRFLAGA